MRPTTRKPLFAVVLLCAAGACVPAATNESGRSPSSAAVGRVEVTNDGHQDVVLYVVRDAMRYRLGHVARMQTAQFRLPQWDARSYHVSLIAEPVGGGRAFATAPVVWHPGQTLQGRVGRNAASYTFDVVLRR